MKKGKKIFYWIFTVWLALGMFSTGIVQLFRVKGEVEFILDLGYPAYFLTLIGIWKILGVIAILIPKFPLLKEWTYAGFFFIMSGAIFSHVATGNPARDIFPPILLLVLTLISWYLRPPDRKVILVNHKLAI
jgi:uncharacterized membrane protein YphA (DoxX/SURF4 family)